MYQCTLVFLLLLVCFAAVSDCLCRRIPNEIIIAGLFLKLTGSFAGILFFYENWQYSAVGVLSAFLITVPLFLISVFYKSFSGRPAFGGGDLKLLFIVCLFFSVRESLWIFLLALIFASAAGILLRIFRKQRQLPFAPSIFAGLLAVAIVRFLPAMN